MIWEQKQSRRWNTNKFNYICKIGVYIWMSNKNLPRGKRREMGLIEDSDFICPPLKLEETIKPFCSEHNGELKFRDQQIYVSSAYMKCENGGNDMKYI